MEEKELAERITKTLGEAKLGTENIEGRCVSRAEMCELLKEGKSHKEIVELLNNIKK